MRTLAFAAVITDGRFGIGLAERDKAGYWPKPIYGAFDSWEEAQIVADKLNSESGLSAGEAALIICSSMAQKGRAL